MILKSIQAGFTLIEMLIAVAVLAILLSIGVGSYESLFKSNQLRGANEAINSLITYAKSESIKSGDQIAVNFKSGANGAWCVGLVTVVTASTSTCDCSANNCKVTSAGNREIVLAGSDFNKITLTASGVNRQRIVFDPVRGMPVGNATALGNLVVSDGLLTESSTDAVKIVVNPIGNITQTCKRPSSSTYAACS